MRSNAAVKFVDFCTSPAIQAEFNPRWNAGPVNRRALENFPSDLIVPGTPELDKLGFTLNSQWWAENRQAVSDRWSNWILEG